MILLSTYFDFTTKCEKIYTFASMHISSSPFLLVAYFSSGVEERDEEGSKLETRGSGGSCRENEEGGGTFEPRWRTIMYHFTDDPIDELRSFRGVDLRWCVEVNR